jgi:oxalate/formate antiporter
VAAAPATPTSLIHSSRIPNRWVQLVAGIIAMMAIANLQYAWTLFTKPMQAHLHVSLAAIQGIFSLFIILETWLVPFEGYLVDRIGPRLMLGFGAILVGLSWIFAGQAETLRGLYFWYCLGGVGAGIVYGGTIGNALKWFPDHRGLCVGLTAGAYGIGTALTVSPIDKMIRASGYQHTLIVWGIIQGIVVLFAALFLARPPIGWTPPGWAEKEVKIKQHVRSSSVDMTPWQMLRQPSFYVIYLMMTMLSFGGLVVTAQLNPMAVSYHVDKVIVAFGMTALVLAITVDRYLNGIILAGKIPCSSLLRWRRSRSTPCFNSSTVRSGSSFSRACVSSHGARFFLSSHRSRAICSERPGRRQTMASSTPRRERELSLPELALPGCLRKPVHGPRSSGP